MSITAAVCVGVFVGLGIISHRSGVPLLPGPARRQALAEQKLKSILPVVDFRGVSFEQAIETLRRQSGADIVANWDAIEFAYVPRSTPVELRLTHVTLEQALDCLVGIARSKPQADVDYTLHNGTIVVTGADRMGPCNYAVVYDLRTLSFDIPADEDTDRDTDSSGQGLMQKGPPASGTLFGNAANPAPAMARAETDDNVVRLIQEVIDPASWTDAGGKGGSISTFDGRAFVVTSWQNHRRIERLLDQLRSPTPLRPE